MELHWLARGVIDHDGVVLAMRSTGGRHTFLPGGHVETDIAEDFETALLRELREGLAVDARISHYLGAVAWRWPEPNVTNYEINRIFAVTVAPCAGDLTSREPELECVCGYGRTNSHKPISSRFRCVCCSRLISAGRSALHPGAWRRGSPSGPAGVHPEERFGAQASSLGIPVIIDRCHQARSANALEPEWEARFEARSYGFRPGRGCHDATGVIYNTLKRAPPRRV